MHVLSVGFSLKLNYAYNSGIILDSCPEGHGLWLEYLELDEVIAAYNAEPGASPAAARQCRQQSSSATPASGGGAQDIQGQWNAAPNHSRPALARVLRSGSSAGQGGPVEDPQHDVLRPWVAFLVGLPLGVVMAVLFQAVPNYAFGAAMGPCLVYSTLGGIGTCDTSLVE